MQTLPPEDHDKKVLRRALGMIDRPVTTMILEAVDPVLPALKVDVLGAGEPALTLVTGTDTDPDDTFLPGLNLASLERQILTLWREGHKTRVIAEIVCRSGSRVSSIITELRKTYGDDVVPRRRLG